MRDQTSIRPALNVLPYAWVILAVVYLASVVAPFNQFKVPPIMPVLMDEFKINLAQAGALMSLIAVTGLVLALPPRISRQRWGPKITVGVALGCMAVGSVLGALSASIGVLLASRVIEGIGVGLIGVAAPATIAIADSRESQLRSGILISAIFRICAFVTLPTLLRFG